jgi:hypothetical protein
LKLPCATGTRPGRVVQAEIAHYVLVSTARTAILAESQEAYVRILIEQNDLVGRVPGM